MAESLSASEGILVLSKLSGAFMAYSVYYNEDVSYFTAPVSRHFEPVGRWYESRARHARLVSCSSGGGIGGENEEEEESEEERGEELSLLSLDPTQWQVPKAHVISYSATRAHTHTHAHAHANAHTGPRPLYTARPH